MTFYPEVMPLTQQKMLHRLEREHLPEMLWPIEWDEVRRMIERWVLAYLNAQAPPRSGDQGVRG